MALIGGVVVIFGPFIAFQKSSETESLEKYFYKLAGIVFIALGFLLILKMFLVGVFAVIFSLVVAIFFSPTKDDRPVLEEALSFEEQLELEKIKKEVIDEKSLD